MVYQEVQPFCMRERYEPILVAESTYIGCHHDQYRFTLPSHRDGFRPKGS